MMTETRNLNSQRSRVGLDWDRIGLEKLVGKQTTTTEFAAKLSDGTIHGLSRTTTRDFSYDFSAYGQYISHIHKVDGDNSMFALNLFQQKIMDKLSHESRVTHVYLKQGPIDQYYITTSADYLEDDKIIDLYWELFDAMPDYKFEFKPIIEANFSDGFIPLGAVKLIGG